METKIIQSIGNEKMPSILKDPFKKNAVTKIYVHFSQGIFDKEKWDASGNVKFSNGNTHGEQKFKGETFDEVVLQIKAFLINLD
jgi:hypothetical protein